MHSRGPDRACAPPPPGMQSRVHLSGGTSVGGGGRDARFSSPLKGGGVTQATPTCIHWLLLGDTLHGILYLARSSRLRRIGLLVCARCMFCCKIMRVSRNRRRLMLHHGPRSRWALASVRHALVGWTPPDR